ncbi:MAG TPA: FTR1 family protein, partial [Nitrospiria bacterium]|nr:FTR1 family protein [Nitrospiria bacterium]
MLGTFLITWRETIEAALIVGILLTFLQKIGQRKHFRTIYWGVFWAVVASVLFGAASNLLSGFLEGDSQEFVEIGILFLATLVLTHMVVWMHHNAREIKGELQQQAEEAIAKSRLWALTMVAFIGVFREGIETVLFIWGLFLQGAAGESVGAAVTGGFFGIGLGVLMAWLFFKGFGHLDLRIFFRISGIILLFMAAGMLSSGIGKLVANGWVPGLIEPIWNTSWILSERSVIGSLFSGLFG